MFFRKFKSTMGGTPAPVAQKMVGLALTLVLVWFVFAEESPLNRGSGLTASGSTASKPDASQGSNQDSGQGSPQTPAERPARRASKAPSPAVASTPTSKT